MRLAWFLVGVASTCLVEWAILMWIRTKEIT